MNSNMQQIVALYEDIINPMSVSEICEACELDETTVKIALAQGSSKYNLALRNEAEEFSDGDKEMVKVVLKQLALSSDSPQVRFRAAKYIYEEKKGRNDAKGLRTVNINITSMQQVMADVRAAAQKAVNKSIDIPEQFEHMKQITA